MRSLSAGAPLALLPTARPLALQETRLGPGVLVSLPTGSIAGDLRAIRSDPKRRRTTYELVVTNESIGPVAAYTYALGQAPDAGANWRTVTIPPFTSIAVTIDIPFAPRGIEQRVVAEIHAGEAHWTIDAHGPRVVEPPPKPAKLAAVSALALALLAGGAYLAFGPRVTALAAPPSVAGGNDFQVAYATSGADRIRWRVENADGVELRGGNLREPRGAISLQLPPATRAEGYDLRLDAASPFGNQTRTIHLVAVPDAAKLAAEPVRIASLAVASQTVSGGRPILITYRTNAGAGTVSLLDQSDNTRASSRLDSSGTTTLQAPHVTEDQSFRILLDAERNGAHAQSSVGVTVKAGWAAPLAAAAAPVTAPEPDGSDAAGTAWISLPKQRYRSGDVVPVTVARNLSNVHVAIANAGGVELSSKDVLPGEGTAVLLVPEVAVTTKLLVVASFGRGVGQETVVRSIVIRPAAKSLKSSVNAP
jgi:hypothetical protein